MAARGKVFTMMPGDGLARLEGLRIFEELRRRGQGVASALHLARRGLWPLNGGSPFSLPTQGPRFPCGAMGRTVHASGLVTTWGGRPEVN